MSRHEPNQETLKRAMTSNNGCRILIGMLFSMIFVIKWNAILEIVFLFLIVYIITLIAVSFNPEFNCIYT